MQYTIYIKTEYTTICTLNEGFNVFFQRELLRYKQEARNLQAIKVRPCR